MRRTLRVFRWLLILLVIVVLVTGAGGYVFLRRTLPQVAGTIKVSGLNAPIDIVRDVDAIPHVFAQSRDDAIFGLGYVHAQDRLWQMEFQRRIGQGRLSEILGESTRDTDRFLRTLGTYRAAEQSWQALSSDSRAAVEAYVAGINAFIAAPSSALPIEFTLLGTTPAPWTGPDVLVWQKMMAWDLGGNWASEVLRTDIIRAVGPERAAALLPDTPETSPSIITAAIPNGDYDGLLTLGAEVRSLMGAVGWSGEGLGSNNWVVDGTKTVSGKPLLANDPHLGTRIPSIWYLAHLSAPDYEVIGATLPGLPTIVIGRNRAIAWGVTNVGPDVQDLYRERLDPTGTLAEFQGQMEPMQVITETIKVKGAEDVIHRVRITRHGPLISDALNTSNASLPETERQPMMEPLAFRWTALDPQDTTLDAFLGINQAQNWDQFVQALRSYVAPSQNFVYADITGNIGYYAPGRIPIRASNDGSLPVEGWSGANEWTGSVPFEELPHVYNPPSHMIVTANNRPTPASDQYFLGREFAPPYRYQRIAELIEAKDKLSPGDFAAIQGDTVSLHARELLPILLQQTAAQTAEEEQVLDLLRQWDGNTNGDSAAAAIFEVWYSRLTRAIAADELGARLIERYEERFTFSRPFIQQVLSEPSPWCDDTTTSLSETCAQIVAETFRDALEEVRSRQGAPPTEWRWDRMHVTVFPHQPLDNVPVLKAFFSRSLPHGGDHSTVNVAPFDFEYPFEQRHSPGYRQIIDLANLEGGQFLHSVGQSGHVLSPHYADYLADWKAIRYRPMRMERTTIDAAAQGTLRLTP
ncbi:MAG TPA: penicillin acylase family protein [Herpetosiphonaceae bacterium]